MISRSHFNPTPKIPYKNQKHKYPPLHPKTHTLISHREKEQERHRRSWGAVTCLTVVEHEKLDGVINGSYGSRRNRRGPLRHAQLRWRYVAAVWGAACCAGPLHEDRLTPLGRSLPLPFPVRVTRVNNLMPLRWEKKYMDIFLWGALRPV